VKKRIVVWGAGGHGKVVAEAAAAAGFGVAGFLDDDAETHGTSVAGYDVIGGVEAFGELIARGVAAAVPAVGDPDARRRLGVLITEAGAGLATVVHPRATVSPTAEVLEGTVVLAGAVVGPGSRVGRLGIVNHNAVVDHDCEIGELVHIAPGVVLAGDVKVGARSLVGAGAVVLPGRSVGSACTVGAGAIVTRDVPDGATAVGVPARPAD